MRRTPLAELYIYLPQRGNNSNEHNAPHNPRRRFER